jgi:tRNA threonylcarbamoyl adenosine modification protein (Sua5/YciO/YrdC/YwlC family)
MLIKLYEKNPNPKEVRKVIDVLQSGGIIIYPTDTVYGLGCDMRNKKAVERVSKLKGINPEKANFSIICSDIAQVTEYTKPLNNNIFKTMKAHLPGPFTFILNAANSLPKIMVNKKKTIGIRIPDNNIIIEIVKTFGNPVLTTSIIDEDDIIEYTTDPELIHEKYEKEVDLIIDGGPGGNIPSTIVDCTGEEPEIIREGLGSEYLS